MAKRHFCIYLLMTLATAVAFPAWNAIAEVEGLVFYLSFEEKGDPVDHSPDPAELSVEGKPKRVNGQLGMGMEFDGNPANHIEVGHSDKLEGMKALTVEAWVRPDNPSAAARGIVSKRIAFQNKDVYNLFLWTGTKIWGRVSANEAQQIGSQTVVKNGTWYHLAYVFDGDAPGNDRQRLYVNGVLESTQSHPGKSVREERAPLWIGVLNSGSGAWKGIIDEVRIWSRCLDENEVKSAMKRTIMPVRLQGKLTTTWGEMKRR